MNKKDPTFSFQWILERPISPTPGIDNIANDTKNQDVAKICNKTILESLYLSVVHDTYVANLF